MPLTLDGARFSGSGTIVRTGVALSALLGEPLHLVNVRARRSPPGLRPQHLKAVEAVAEMVGGRVEGARVGSREIRFQPRTRPRGGTYRWDIGTAGSTTMLALTLLPLALFADGPCTFHLRGGLFQDFAPSAFHTQRALLPLLARMGVRAELEVLRPGYVPKGGGEVRLRVWPPKEPLKPLVLPERSGSLNLQGIALESHLAHRRVAERMASACQEVLEGRGLRARFHLVHDTTAPQPGCALALFATDPAGPLLGADRAGAPGRPSERIGQETARALLEDLDTGATVDRHLADQLLLYAGLARGVSEFLIPAVTDHVETGLWLLEEVLGAKVALEGLRLRIEGIGFAPWG